MKAAPLTLLLVWAAPARADIALPQPAAKKAWAASCAARIDEAAEKLGFKPGARVSVIPLRHEDGTPNPVLRVEYAPSLHFVVTVGEDGERLPDMGWQWRLIERPYFHGYRFRRYHGRFALIFENPDFMAATDDCLNMGESK